MTDLIDAPTATVGAEWHPTACILCECNCGIEVRLGEAIPTMPTSRRFDRIRGDKAHPASKGYTCEKALRLDHYQNGANDRILSPLRRRADGTFEEVDWDTAIREVAERLSAVRDAHGGESILYYGGGGQGNHLGGAYGAAMFRAFGGRYRSSALAQEKTGEFWVNGKMFGTLVRAEFEHAEVALFLGKNPWQSHSIPHARTTLKEIANDPARALIVIDPRRTETADLALSSGGFHLQVRPGRDAWLVGALAAVIAQERLYAAEWLADHATGVDEALALLGAVPVAEWSAIAGVDEQLVRQATRRIAAADSVAVFEDLGVQHNRYSTLVSWLEKLVWVLTGNYAKPGARLPRLNEIFARIEQWTMTKTKFEAMDILNEYDIPCGPILSMKEIAEEKSLRDTGTVVEVDHPTRGKYLSVGNPIKLSNSPTDVKRSPLLGEHTEEILSEVLGFSPGRIEEIRQSGALGAPSPIAAE